jgi:hypothetical protein
MYILFGIMHSVDQMTITRKQHLVEEKLFLRLKIIIFIKFIKKYVKFNY